MFYFRPPLGQRALFGNLIDHVLAGWLLIISAKNVRSNPNYFFNLKCS